MLYSWNGGANSWAVGNVAQQDSLKKKQIFVPKIYTIYNISMDETASTSRVASQAAVKLAEREALEKLFRKIIREEDQIQLPEITDGQVTELVSGIEVANEKSSSVRYLADFTIHFSREKIYNFLSELQIPFAETLSSPVSVLTVLEQEGAGFLWEKENPWRAAWAKFDTVNNLVPLHIIGPSYENRMALTLWQAQMGDIEALQDFADHKNIRKLYVITAKVDKNILNNSWSLNLTIHSNKERNIYTKIFTREDITHASLVEHFGERGSENTMTALYNEAIKEATYWIDNQWKEKVMIHFGLSSHLNINIAYENAEDWFEIKKKLESLSLIRSVTYKKFTVKEAEIDIEYSGDVEQIILALEQEKLTLTNMLQGNEYGDKDYWLLRIAK